MESRARLRRNVTPQRAVLTFGILLGMVALVASVARLLSGPELDFHAYYFAGKAVLQGNPFVGYAVKEGTFLTRKEYVYVPVTVLSFLFYGAFPRWEIPYLINAGILVVTFLALSRITTSYIESQGRSLEPIDRWLIRGFFVLSLPSVLGIYRGNVDPIILLMLVVGFLAIERGRGAVGGSLWAIASLFKLFPALLGVWLLHRRAWRAVAGAIVVGCSSLAASVLLFGVDANVEFVEFILEERSRNGAFEGGLGVEFMYLSLKRPLSHLLPIAGHALTLVAFAVLSPLLFLLYRRASTAHDQLLVLFGTLIALLITIVPSTAGYVVYLLFPLVALAYVTEDWRARRCFVAGLVLINLPVFPRHIHDISTETSLSAGFAGTVLSALEAVLTYGSVTLWGMLLVLAGCLFAVSASGGDSP